jgi:hypothetical protein
MAPFGKHTRVVLILFGLSFGASAATAGQQLWRGDLFPPNPGDPIAAAFPTHRWMVDALHKEVRSARRAQLIYSLMALTICFGLATAVPVPGAARE